jgi:hypothetical protein
VEGLVGLSHPPIVAQTHGGPRRHGWFFSARDHLFLSQESTLCSSWITRFLTDPSTDG